MKKRRPLKRSKPRRGWGTGFGYHTRKWSLRNVRGLTFLGRAPDLCLDLSGNGRHLVIVYGDR